MNIIGDSSLTQGAGNGPLDLSRTILSNSILYLTAGHS